MDRGDFWKLLIGCSDELIKLVEQREEIDLKIAKLHQFTRATANMLPDDNDRLGLMFELNQLVGDAEGLTDAIRTALKASDGKALTAVEVRDGLLACGFDFSGYTPNPLAGVHAVLKRMKPEEVEVVTVEGVAAYRWKPRQGQIGKFRKRFRNRY